MSDGRIDNTKQLPNNLKGFTLEINALDAEMSQMGHYDDEFHPNYYPSVEYNVDSYDLNHQGKRKFQSQIQAAQDIIDANKLKKRFVWPEPLHRDFVSAVFDIGLKNSTSKLLLQMLPQSRKITTENLKSHLQKFRIHRDRNRGDYSSYYEMSTRQGEGKTAEGEEGTDNATSSSETSNTPTNATTKKASNPNLHVDTDSGGLSRTTSSGSGGPSAMAIQAENNRQAALEKIYILENSLRLKGQIDNIANYIAEQSTFLFSLKNSISRQTKLHAQLINKLSQLDPTSSSAAVPNSNLPDNLRPLQLSSSGTNVEGLHIPPEQVGTEPTLSSSSAKVVPRLDISGSGSGSGPTSVCTARAELQIMSEMRSHMDMHRQLLMRKEDQISRHKRGEELNHYANGVSLHPTNCSHPEDYSYHAGAEGGSLVLMGPEGQGQIIDGEADHQIVVEGQEMTYTDSGLIHAHPAHLSHDAMSLSREHDYLYHHRLGDRLGERLERGAEGGHDMHSHASGNLENGEMKKYMAGAGQINYNINLTEMRAMHSNIEMGLEGYAERAHAHSYAHTHAAHTGPSGGPGGGGPGAGAGGPGGPGGVMEAGTLPPGLRHHHLAQTNEGKVMAHSEGLNAADWNWDAEDSLDHNLFSFLLDPINHRSRTNSE